MLLELLEFLHLLFEDVEEGEIISACRVYNPGLKKRQILHLVGAGRFCQNSYVIVDKPADVMAGNCALIRCAVTRNYQFFLGKLYRNLVRNIR